MSWKSLVVLVATLAFDASLMAQDKQSDPFLGIWELNLEKTTNYPQQSQTMINVPAPGGGFISTRATIGKDNKSSSTEIHFRCFRWQASPDHWRRCDRDFLQTDPIRTRSKRTHNRNGRISVDTEQISKDGKTMTVKQAKRRPNLRQEI
ncbi:MAG TPA: hypothetical protein VE422_41080 [Terriglobia bacterium]|nr:hypothetical protein [Terriglobia bacterium]